MPFTVRDLIKLPMLSEAKIIAGEKGQKRIIKSISFLEAPDSINWVMPHDFLLTNAYLLYSHPDIKDTFISELSFKEAAAIGIKLNRYIQSIPEEMISQADKYSLPIIILPFNVTPGQLIANVAKTLYETKKTLENPPYFFYDFFYELFYGKNVSKTTLLKKASSIGWDFSKSYNVVLIKVDKQSFLKKILSIIRKESSNPGNFVYQFEQEIIVLFETGSIKEAKNELVKYGKEIIRKCTSEIPGLHIEIGIGQSYNNLLDLNKSHGEAKKAIYLNQYDEKKGCIAMFDDLGVYKILSQFDDLEKLESYHEDTVGKLEKYDLQNNSEYYLTVKSFVHLNGNYNKTAAHLCVHYNTVKYRINAINKILGIDLEDPEKRLDIQIGLKIGNLLKIQPQIRN